MAACADSGNQAGVLFNAIKGADGKTYFVHGALRIDDVAEM